MKKCAVCGRSGKLCIEFDFRRFFELILVKKFLCVPCVTKVSTVVDDYETQRKKKNKRGDALAGNVTSPAATGASTIPFKRPTPPNETPDGGIIGARGL